jgi:hypothetical protein
LELRVDDINGGGGKGTTDDAEGVEAERCETDGNGDADLRFSANTREGVFKCGERS